MRRLTLDDADLMLAIWNDPAFVCYVGDRGVRTLAEAREKMTEGAFKLYEDYGYGPYRVALRDGDTAVGTCGLFRRDGLEHADIGYGFLPEYCRRGYAYESARAVIEHARTDIGLARIIAIVSPDNAASIGLTEKLGLQFEKATRLAGEDHDVSLYSMSLQA
jgi:RimJ/RimL family protein N-acetyltransferase